MAYVFDTVDFKKYLFSRSPKFRVEGLSLWAGSIPLPIDLFDQLFRDSHHYFELYLDHLLAALMIGSAISNKTLTGIELQDLPDKQVVDDNYRGLEVALELEFKSNLAKYHNFSEEMATALAIDSYTIHIPSLLAALSHKGKKYLRIYCPLGIKKKVALDFDKFPEGLAYSNGDMFGNIVADKLGVYRSGFSDCLADLFNKLLDFKLDECSGSFRSEPKITLAVHSSSKGIGLADRFIFDATSDGSLWEPSYDGEYKVKLNPGHPYFKKLPEYTESSKSFYEFVAKISEYEAKLMDRKGLKYMESMRSTISRALWIENDSG